MMINIQEIKEEYNNYLDRVGEAAHTIAELLRENQIPEALGLIGDLSEGMNWLSEVNSKLKILNESVELNINSIGEFLLEINNGLEIQDFVLVADLFEYEVSPFFINCNKYDLTSEQ
jgi:DNA repair ATPase RecN